MKILLLLLIMQVKAAPVPIPEPTNLQLKYAMASFSGSKAVKRIRHEVLRERRRKLSGN
jgi:hypothetical protein